MTTSASLPHDLADKRIGTGFMFNTVKFLRFFHLGRWAAMTLPISAVRKLDM